MTRSKVELGADVFTSGQAAKICRVSQQTINKAFDNGHIPGGFKVPGSRFRRIPRDALLNFMRASGISTDELEGDGRINVLVISTDSDVVQGLQAGCSAMNVQTTDNSFDGGMMAKDLRPQLIVVDFAIGREAGLNTCKALGNGAFETPPQVIALLDDGMGGRPEGAQITFNRPLNAEVIARKIYDALVGTEKD